MDENYLDSLLGGASSGDNNNFDNNVDADSGVDIDMSDLRNISLDELDDLDSLDLGDLELDDIDFDDVDVTKLDTQSANSPEPGRVSSEMDNDSFNLDELISGLEAENASYDSGSMQDSEDAGSNNVFDDADMLFEQDTSYPDVFGDALGDSENSDSMDEDSIQNMDLDELFSALGIEDDASDKSSYTAGEESLEELLETTMARDMENGQLNEIADVGAVKEKTKKVKKTKVKGEPHTKKSISEILFGEPDDDDREEEQRLQIKKAEKVAQKEQKKTEKDAKAAAKKDQLALKKREAGKKKEEKAARKKAMDEELDAELAGEKKVSTPVAILIFAAFIILGAAVVFGAKEFNYAQVVKKAADYFDRQRYRLAYDEMSGVEVEEDDIVLRDRIYTVMYVERLYESYENNMELNRPDKALDALFRGLEKYDEHYQEAVKLRVAEDINFCKDKIVNALWNTYGLSEARAYEIMELTGQEYLQALYECCYGLETGE